ncbi:MAG: Ig-like domain-containing protein [Lachnospiraceae bacterium]|nr:Ig-like domain-containing protein [Lachnospiraceae bacterium]
MNKKTKNVMAALMLFTMTASSLTMPDMANIAKAATKKITINNVPYDTLTMKKGTTFQLKAKAGSSKKQKITYSSSNKKVATVSSKGKIKAVKNGKATITIKAKIGNYKNAQVKVTVGTKVSQIKVLRPAMVIYAGSTATIKSEVLPSKASNKTINYSSSNKKIATVSNTGVVKGLKAGTAQITLAAKDGSGIKTKITVKVEKDSSEVQLVDDFYQNVNAELINNTDLDVNVGEWSQFSQLEDKQEAELDTILEDVSKTANPQGSVADQVSDVYQTALDTETRNKQDIKTIQEYFDKLEKVTDISSYMTLMGELSKEGMDGIFSTAVTSDLKLANTNRVYFNEMYLGVYSPEYGYTALAYLNPYKNYIKRLLELSGESKEEADSHTEEIMTFQQNISRYALSMTDAYDTDKLYNPYSILQLENMFTNCDIKAYLNAAGFEKVNTFILLNPSMLKALNTYLTTKNLDLLKEFAKFRILCLYAPYLTTDFYDAYEDFYTVLTMEKKQTIEDFSKEMVESVLNWNMSKLYVDKYVNKNTKSDLTTMVDKIIQQYYAEIQSCTWMSQQTKDNAIKKLDTMKTYIAYPDDWSNYTSSCQLKGSTEGGILSENIKQLYIDSKVNQLNKLNESYDANQWIASPLTINAYYMPTANSITIPVGILRDAIYDANKNDAANYGTIGVIIGHEISHAFDATGSLYDENGNSSNWWTDSDRTKYQAIQKKLENYYNTFEVLPGVFQNGLTTLSENIADLAGANCTIKLVENTPSARDTYFRSYANLWASKMTDKTVNYYVNYDNHSLKKVRVNAIVSLMDEFYETYNVKSTDAMYVAPEDRIKIWY